MYGLALSSVVLALLLVLQTIGLPKPITGIFVNGSFVLVTRRCGPAYGMLLSITTPFVAVLTGILPAPLLPLTMPIVLGNVTFVALYYISLKKPFTFLRGESPWPHALWRLIIAPAGKAVVIALGANLIVRLMTLPPSVTAVVNFIVFIQLATAALGIVVGEYLDGQLPQRPTTPTGEEPLTPAASE